MKCESTLVFSWWKYPGKDTQRVSNIHFLPPPGVSLVTLEGLSRRVQVAVESDDEDPGKLFGVGRFVFGSCGCERCLPFLRVKARKWEPLGLDACALVSAVCRWVIPEASSSVRKQSKRQCGLHLGLKKEEILQDTRSCVIHVLLMRKMMSLHTVPQRNSSTCLSIIWVFWERHQPHCGEVLPLPPLQDCH